MKNKINLKHVLLALSSVMILILIIYFLLLSYSFSWSDWEDYKKFTTGNGSYSIILRRSNPPTPGSNFRIKIICRDEINNKEKDFEKFTFSFSIKDDNTWFEFIDINSNQAELIAYDFNGEKKFTFIWSDIFK